MKHYVARPYGKPERHLWKIASRPIGDREGADLWCSFMNSAAETAAGNPCPARGKYFVVEVTDANEASKA